MIVNLGSKVESLSALLLLKFLIVFTNHPEPLGSVLHFLLLLFS